MRAFYGNRFSPNMTKTPEGFLICHNVPIARTGWQKYLPREIGIQADGLINVYRSEGEVFSAATIASFEGKPVTDNHPPIGVDACNYAAYMKGVVQNVRKGSGEQSDCLIADLVIHDATLISEIDAGKREISCGYDCGYEQHEDGTCSQVKIAGNHVAIVKAGRAGNKIAIQDEKPREEGNNMKEKSIWDRMFNVFVKDADPEQIKEAAEAVKQVKDTNEAIAKAAEKEQTTDTAARLTLMDARIANIEKLLTKDAEQEEKTALDELEEELSKEKTDDTEEESVTVAPDDLQKDEDETEKAEVQDAAPLLALVRAMKPVVATLPEKQRQSVSDAMSKAVRDAMGVKPTQTATYAQMVKRKANDAATPASKAAYGEACRKRNPHYKEGK